MESQNGNHHAPNVAARNAPSITDEASSKYHSAEDINPRARKRRRADSRASTNSIAQADHQELAELYSHTGLSYNSGAAVPLQPLEVATNGSLTSRHVPNGTRAMESVDMGGMYAFGGDKLQVQVPRPQSPVKYETDLGYGPYHAQYWSFVQGDLSAGTPHLSNGGYQSPYASLASDPYYPAVQDPQLDIPGDMHQNGFSSDGIFSSPRQGHYHSMAPDASNVYPSPVDNFTWQYPAVEPVPLVQSIPVLDNLATQILTTLWSSTVPEFAAIVDRPERQPKGQAYATLEALFEQTKKSFSRDQLFLDPNTLHLDTAASIRAIRKANLATFVICVFRGRDVPFLELNEAFLDIFMPTGTRLFKSEGALFLELKTQAYIAVMLTTDLAKEDVLDQLFPRDLQLVILRRRSEPAHLAPTEQDFIGRISTRRQYLLAGSDDIDALSQLPHKYNWQDFLDEVRICVGRALDLLEGQKDTNGASVIPASSSAAEDPITKATLAAHAAISGQPPTTFQNTFHSPTIQHTPSFSDDPHSHKRKRTSLSDSSQESSSISPKTPTAPMQHQYEVARATTHPKTTPFTNRRPGAPSQRRPWTQEEEKALMDGLDRVKGPHWSQILALYGAGGSLSEILKDRNQVQLKDKARNLKLFFLKSGIEVPVYLQRVTGELKTRAPAQAAKLEARERLKALEEENDSRSNGAAEKKGAK